MKTVQTVNEHGYVVRVDEVHGRYRFYNPKPAYALDDRVYATEQEATEAMLSHIRDNYGSDVIEEDDIQTEYYISNGAERDDENFEITFKIVEVSEYKVETVTTILI